MAVQTIESARYLVQYIKSVEDLKLTFGKTKLSYNHIGALFTDIVLQAGLNYETVVKPRVNKVLIEYPQATNLSSFKSIIDTHGLRNVINWKHETKIERFHTLIDFCVNRGINDCYDLKSFLKENDNRILFLSIKGLGPKTLDYTMKLLQFDTIAVDRHIIGFIELAGLKHTSYDYTKKTVEFAADLLNIPRSTLDQTIWNYMSSRRGVSDSSSQLRMTF
ncbi:hypothetical protein D2V93_17845 [Flagellimonas taeanensis]|uniref:hypothetical protein n=1 Tax=Flavobacteriaceae TaxID=49546 RepID=UPI000E6A310B|nr:MULTISPECIES: hypothetical protein [Allomuricauda]MDC6386296.1 hypothetical protein [Muricauda sp. SK9]RIV48028.1 hypothetical protein D2V93_17845 [Allomuricauda taeanensis]